MGKIFTIDERDALEKSYRGAEGEVLDALRGFDEWRRNPKDHALGNRLRQKVVRAFNKAQLLEKKMQAFGWEFERPLSEFRKSSLLTSPETKRALAAERMPRMKIKRKPLWQRILKTRRK